ncbi:hypothetical protein NLU13_6078 [Sarocladium strictum]|uniref:Tat pathway signal sequence n=1 Tax=Sarocladium strictum TaxID=5046 RepID=A0AA39GFJ8_SARSR|nr:hypothetical protein NLU13_6078 [Sarocladium strictum]
MINSDSLDFFSFAPPVTMEKEPELTRPLVPAEADDDAFSSVDGDDSGYAARRRGPRKAGGAWVNVIIVCVGLLTATITFVGGVYFGSQYNLESRCATATTQWSPLLRDVKVRYRETEFDGQFHKESIFRKAPSPEVDAAWDGLGIDYRAGAISYKDGLASGLEPSFVQRAEKYGGGFMVNVEGMHHLHCLNLVRKSLYFNHQYYEALGENEFLNNGTMLEHHITHCLDTVRQVLMCNVDTGVLGQRWVDENEPYGFPDFQTTHKCKNYDDVRKWAEKLQAPPSQELPRDYLAKPKAGDVLAAPP